tara:strand:- start:513 stop:920 length:408 start_codon:yes stop_codon:yes gene_type:complete
MKKAELKQVLKPLIKECIKEVIFEEGVLSGIISEVVKGTNNVVLEAKRETKGEVKKSQKAAPRPKPEQNKKRIDEARKRLLDSIGAPAYDNIFDDVEPLAEGNSYSPLSGVSSNDGGVDISQIPGLSNWKTLAKK